MTTNAESAIPVVAVLVPEDQRISVLPSFFALRQMIRAEGLTYNAMKRLSPDYTGAYWHYYRLSNGGFYMAPAIDKPMRIEFFGNQYEGVMTADAAGIVASLVMLNIMAEDGTERTAELYHLLRDFALDHAEAGEIFRAID